ncbi:MAG: Maf family protein [Lachnospiraceae bacterium]|nr:Maf family protein [Lachnospiraceae bacterium]
MNSIILASGSPRRKEILNNHEIPFRVCVSEVDETCDHKSPKEMVMELSKRKALAVFTDYPNEIVLGADTVVAYKDEILGKPKNDEDAFRMLHMLQGHSHQVYTGVTICSKDLVKTFYEKTDVIVRPMSEDEIYSYIATGEGCDKAGSYAIQGLFKPYISSFEGDYENVVGLPGKKVKEQLFAHFIK